MEDNSAADQLIQSEKKFEEVTQAIAKKNAKITELVSLEENYLDDLEKISLYYDEVKKSKEDPNYPVSMPLGLRDGRDLIVFGNIKALYDFHSRIFTKGIRNSNNDPAKFLELFKKRKSDLMLRYGKYSINKPKSELIVGNFQEDYFTKMETHLQQEMRLADHLIKPVQHFMRYTMIINEVVRFCKIAEQEDEAAKFQECHDIAREINMSTNEMMVAGSIEDFPGDISKQGELLHRGPVTGKVPSLKKSIFSRGKSAEKFEPCHIFVFQKSVVICFHSQRETDYETKDEFRHWHTFLINKMQVRSSSKDQNLHFELYDLNQESKVSNLSFTTSTLEKKEKIVEKISTEINRLKNFQFDLGNPTL